MVVVAPIASLQLDRMGTRGGQHVLQIHRTAPPPGWSMSWGVLFRGRSDPLSGWAVSGQRPIDTEYSVSRGVPVAI